MTKLSFHYMIFRSSSEVTSIYCFKFLAIKKKTTSQIKKKTGRLNCKSRDIKKKTDATNEKNGSQFKKSDPS